MKRDNSFAREILGFRAGRWVCVCGIVLAVALLGTCSKRVDVADLSVTVPAEDEETVYYRFARGDHVILDAEAANGDKPCEVTVTELPSSVRFSSNAFGKIVGKRLFVSDSAIYAFEMRNTSGDAAKEYRLRIRRDLSVSGSSDFNTSVTCEPRSDTTWQVELESTLVVDSLPEELVNTKLGLALWLTFGQAEQCIAVQLPDSTAYWLYWLAVGKTSQDAAAFSLPLAELLEIANPAAALTVNMIPRVTSAATGDKISLSVFSDSANLAEYRRTGKAQYLVAKRSVTEDCGKLYEPRQGKAYILLSNDDILSLTFNKNVTLRVVAMRVFHHYDVSSVERPVVRRTMVPVGRGPHADGNQPQGNQSR